MSTTTASVDIEMDSKPSKKDMPFDPFSLPIFFLCIGILGCTVSNMVNLGEAKDGVMSIMFGSADGEFTSSLDNLPGLIQPHEPPIAGIMPGKTKPKIILSQDVDWPPYAYVGVPPENDFDVAGFGHDVAHGLKEVCDIDIVTRQADWAQCWGSNKIGAGLDAGIFHGCMTYTHTAGVRNRYMDFSYGILSANKPAGILTRLGSDGKPVIDPMSDLSGKKIVDVAGWAPTADGLALVTNKCTNERYAGYTVLTPATDGNDAAMAMLRSGEADGMFVYADQAYNYRPNQDGVTATWDVSLWTGFGTAFAYISTGQLGHSYNGTTLAISKRGSGLNDILNPCIQSFMDTKSYHDVCVKHGFEASCYPNSHFTAADATPKPWMLTTEHTDCATGYCPCSAGVSTGSDTLVEAGSGVGR